MKRRPIGTVEKDGEWHVIHTEEQKRKGWTYHPGMTSVPGPDMRQAEIEVRLEQEILADLKTDPRWVVRRQEIEDEYGRV